MHAAQIVYEAASVETVEGHDDVRLEIQMNADQAHRVAVQATSMVNETQKRLQSLTAAAKDKEARANSSLSPQWIVGCLLAWK